MKHGARILVCQPGDRVWHTLRAEWGTVEDVPGTEHLGVPQVDVWFDHYDGAQRVSADLLRAEDEGTAGYSQYTHII